VSVSAFSFALLIEYLALGIGVQSYGTVIIHAINPSLSSINLSLLFAPIWIMDLIAILLITPLSDRFHTQRHLIFCLSCLVILAGLLGTTFAGGNASWSRYGGLLIIGFGLGPTVPTIMAMSTSIFQARHGEVGVAAASALVSGLGNLGSILTTYALYSGWPADSKGPHKYRKSNLVMVGMVCASIVASGVMVVLLRVTAASEGSLLQKQGLQDGVEKDSVVIDGAAKRELREMQGNRGLWGLGRIKVHS
jgi:MFS family permease